MALNEARKTLGYADLPKLGLSRRDKARTLGYHQLPNGDINPTGLGAPLTLAPRPVTLLPAPPAPPRPASRQHLQLVPRFGEIALPVSKLTRASDVAPPTPVVAPPTLLEAAAFDLVPRARQTTFGDPWFHRAPVAVEPELELDEGDEVAPATRVRSIVVRTLAALSFVACVAGAVYVAEQNPAALTAVTSWATLGQR